MSYNKWPNLWNNWKEVQDNIGGGQPGPTPGGDVTKEYVDQQDQLLSDRITDNTNKINLKQDKLEAETQSGDLTDAHTLSDVNLTTKKNNKWTLLKIFNYIWDKIKTTKLITSITTSATDEQVASAKGIKKYVDDRTKYIHTLVRYNDDSKTYPMGWWKYIDDKETVTIQDFKNFLKNGGYNSQANCWYWAGGCAGTMGVRNSADTGTSYVGTVVSGVYYVEAEDSMYFKHNYNGSATIVWSRINLFTEQI